MNNVITFFLAGLYMTITLSESQARPLSVNDQTDLTSQRKVSNSGHDVIIKRPRRRRAVDVHIGTVGDRRLTLTLEGDKHSTPVPVVELSIEIVVVVLVVAILATVVLVTYRKLQSKNETSKLVKCSHVLCPGRRQEANAGNKDIESVTDPPYHPVSPKHERPLQYVTPITRANSTHHESPDTHDDWSTIPYADMSMSPEQPHTLETYVEVVNEQAHMSTTPLIQNMGYTNGVDTELTAQKTAA